MNTDLFLYRVSLFPENSCACSKGSLHDSGQALSLELTTDLCDLFSNLPDDV